MHIAWQYLDKRSAALCALKDYESMNHILSHSEAERLAIREHMEGIPSSLPSAIPCGVRNPRAGEDRLISGLDKMNELAARPSAGPGLYGLVSARMGRIIRRGAVCPLPVLPKGGRAANRRPL